MPLPLGDLALLLFHDPLVERLEEFGQRDPEVPVELVRVVDPVARREARPNRVLPAVAFRLVLLEVDREGSRLHERPDSPHLLLDDGVDLVIRVLRLVLEPADFHEELLALPESREELHDVLGRDDPHGLVFLGHDDRGDVVLGHQLDRAMHVRVGPDREGRIAHDAPHLDDDLLLAARSVPVLLSDLRAGEEVDDVLQPDNALQVPALVDDRHRAFGERPYDLHRVLDGVVLRHALRVRRHEVPHDDALQGPRLDERANDVRPGDDPDEGLPLDDGDRAEPGRDHFLRGVRKGRLGRDFRRVFQDGRDLRGRREVPTPHQLPHRDDADELLAFEDREFVDVVRLHLAEDIPERVVPTRGHDVRGHEVGHPEVLDLVPLHEEPAGERAIAGWRIRKVRPLPPEPIAAPDLSEATRERSEPLRGFRASIRNRLSVSPRPSRVVSRSSRRRSGARSRPSGSNSGIVQGEMQSKYTSSPSPRYATRTSCVSAWPMIIPACRNPRVYWSRRGPKSCMRGKNGRNSVHSFRPTCCVSTSPPGSRTRWTSSGSISSCRSMTRSNTPS